MAPTRIYVKSLAGADGKAPGLVKGMAHITGGGLVENVPRVLAENLTAVLKKDAWEMPASSSGCRAPATSTRREM